MLVTFKPFLPINRLWKKNQDDLETPEPKEQLEITPLPEWEKVESAPCEPRRDDLDAFMRKLYEAPVIDPESED